MRKILITGGQGFIGGRLADYLSKDINNSVTITSRNPIPNQNKSNINRLKVNTKHDNLEQILVGYDTVIHLAALDAKNSVKYPLDSINVNIYDTLKWRMAADKMSVRQFIYLSTIHVYGEDYEGIIDEKSCTFPNHPYSISHKCAEDYVLYSGYNQNSNGIVFRLSNAFGYPVGKIHQWHLVVLDFCRQAVRSNKIIIKSNSSQNRDFICLLDVCEGINFGIHNISDSEVYNLASGINKSLLDLAHLIKKVAIINFNQGIEIIEESDKKSTKPKIIDTQKLAKIGFTPSNDFESEIMQLLIYCKNNFHNSW